MSQNYRLLLRVAAKSMAWMAVAAVGYVFLSSMFSGKDTVREVPTLSIEVAHWQPGDTQAINWAGRPVVIHRRTVAEIESIETPGVELVDPNSAFSQQNASAENLFRSVDPQWFVAIALGTDFVCSVDYRPASNEQFKQQPWPGGYVDSCDGSRFDGAGRVFADQKASRNMIVPDYQIRDSKIVLGAL
ncbi:MAG: hypothetical protein KTR35_03135 [Gammaproteobacteria bacterium]|nr:hypothetical protein [Gammaproteobacteria bacterium]